MSTLGIGGEDVRPRVVATPGGPVEVAATGAGPAVLALHGAMGGWDQGLILARSVGAAGFRWVAPSRPGFLGTPRSAGRTPEAQADRCAEVLDALGAGPAAVVAVSGGGPCALQLALRHPARCWAVVVISACTTGNIDVRLPLAWHVLRLAAGVPALEALARGRAERDPDGAARRSIPDRALRARTLGDPEAGGLLRDLQRSTLERMAARLPGTEDDIATSRRDLGFPLERISAPLLAVHGTADPGAPFAQAQALVSRVPGAELLAIEGGGHAALFTHLAEVRARVGAFLRAHAPRAAAAARTQAG
jgi:pimeloyl-ACP methyl ester carboxylesterase